MFQHNLFPLFNFRRLSRPAFHLSTTSSTFSFSLLLVPPWLSRRSRSTDLSLIEPKPFTSGGIHFFFSPLPPPPFNPAELQQPTPIARETREGNRRIPARFVAQETRISVRLWNSDCFRVTLKRVRHTGRALPRRAAALRLIVLFITAPERSSLWGLHCIGLAYKAIWKTADPIFFRSSPTIRLGAKPRFSVCRPGLSNLFSIGIKINCW